MSTWDYIRFHNLDVIATLPLTYAFALVADRVGKRIRRRTRRARQSLNARRGMGR